MFDLARSLIKYIAHAARSKQHACTMYCIQYNHTNIFFVRHSLLFQSVNNFVNNTPYRYVRDDNPLNAPLCSTVILLLYRSLDHDDIGMQHEFQRAQQAIIDDRRNIEYTQSRNRKRQHDDPGHREIQHRR